MSKPVHSAGIEHSRLTRVRLSERDVQDAKRLLGLLLPRRLSTDGYQTASDFKKIASSLIHQRASRARFFPRAMFGEPAWEMLLTLYVSSDNMGSSIASIAEQLGAPRSSVARWGRYLEMHGFIEKLSNPKDARSHLVQLTDYGRKNVEMSLTAGVSPIEA